MAPQGAPRFVYRYGAYTNGNFTPRLGKDTQGRSGQAPGLSTFEILRLGPKDKAQMIDLTMLKPPLQGIPDDPSAGGTPGHLAIVPVDATGAIDQKELEAWAATRGHASPHPFTQLVLDAVIQTDVRR